MDYSQSPFNGTQACKDLPKAKLELFFPDKEEDSPKEYMQKVMQAKEICLSCPIRKACLAHALDHTSLIGVWGGTTTSQRTRMRSMRNRGLRV